MQMRKTNRSDYYSNLNSYHTVVDAMINFFNPPNSNPLFLCILPIVIRHISPDHESSRRKEKRHASHHTSTKRCTLLIHGVITRVQYSNKHKQSPNNLYFFQPRSQFSCNCSRPRSEVNKLCNLTLAICNVYFFTAVASIDCEQTQKIQLWFRKYCS